MAEAKNTLDTQDVKSSGPAVARRIIAVRDHDGIAAPRRVFHLTSTCQVSATTARRILRGCSGSMQHLTLIRLGRGLNVGCGWLMRGALDYVHARIWRIEFEKIKGYPSEDATRIMRMFAGALMGHPKATNLLDLAADLKLSFEYAARLM